jgi:phenylalanyl-tRNA synthetase beta chain
MKATLNWLKQYVDFDWSAEQLAERLTMLGLEVEGVRKVAGEFEGIVIAQILSKDKVPGSDKLSVCKVNDGKGERTIICGAQNHNVGDKVPLILPNFALPLKPGEKEPFVIKERKVFGILSQGMMCSPQELGLPDKVDGLLILPADAPVGKLFSEYMGRAPGDVVFDLEITPNRSDWNSVIGIAREIAALTGNPLRLPAIEHPASSIQHPASSIQHPASSIQHPASSIEHPESRIQNPESRIQNQAADLVSVRLDDPELCPRYTARIVRGVKIGPSPDWLRLTLEKLGIRSISNVVDVTNFVMLEIGQPLHAFDYHLIAKADDGKPAIVVRRARDGEDFVTLDGQKHKLSADNLLIADEQKGIALAGIMGGQNTEINERTVDVLIESAHFKPTNIRRTSKVLGLRSESSYRFERGSDVGICDWASRRAVQLILETAGGEAAQGAVDAYPRPVEPKQITLRHRKANELLGLSLRPEEIEHYLSQLGLKITGRKPKPVGESTSEPEPAAFQIPTFRVDLKREVDLIEEIARLHGVDKIPSTRPRGAFGTNTYDAVHDQLAEARRILTGLGLDEAQSQTLVDDYGAGRTVVDEFGIQPTAIPAPSEAKALVKLSNPMNSDMNTLRPSLLVGLFDSVAHNHAHKNQSVALFEIGKTFRNETKITEHRCLAVVLSGLRSSSFWAGDDRNLTL